MFRRVNSNKNIYNYAKEMGYIELLTEFILFYVPVSDATYLFMGVTISFLK